MKRIKRSFILIELLIAITLIISCLLPLATDPILALSKNRSLWSQAQEERHARLLAANIRERLIKGEISLEKASKGQVVEEGLWNLHGTYKLILVKASDDATSYYGVQLEVKKSKKQKIPYDYYFLIKDSDAKKTI